MCEKYSLPDAVIDYLVWLKTEKEHYKQNMHAQEWIPHVETKLIQLLTKVQKSNE